MTTEWIKSEISISLIEGTEVVEAETYLDTWSVHKNDEGLYVVSLVSNGPASRLPCVFAHKAAAKDVAVLFKELAPDATTYSDLLTVPKALVLGQALSRVPDRLCFKERILSNTFN